MNDDNVGIDARMEPDHNNDIDGNQGMVYGTHVVVSLLLLMRRKGLICRLMDPSGSYLHPPSNCKQHSGGKPKPGPAAGATSVIVGYPCTSKPVQIADRKNPKVGHRISCSLPRGLYRLDTSLIQ